MRKQWQNGFYKAPKKPQRCRANLCGRDCLANPDSLVALYLADAVNLSGKWQISSISRWTWKEMAWWWPSCSC